MAEITDIRIQLDPEPLRPEIRAFVSLSYAGLGLRWCKIIRTRSGQLRLNFPDQPIRRPCVDCGHKVAITHRYCPHCGMPQPFRVPEPSPKDGRPHRYFSIVFPIGATIRRQIELAVFHAYEEATRARASAG